MNNILTVSKLESERVECCPHCGEVVFKASPTGWCKSVQQKYIFSNGGDTFSGVWRKLTDKQRFPNAFHYAYNIGYCSLCLESFFAIEFNFINHDDESGNSIERTDVGSYLLFNEDMDEPENYVVSQSLYADIPGSWILSVFKTPYGSMSHHYIGLMDAECLRYDGDIMLRLFDSLKLAHVENHLC